MAEDPAAEDPAADADDRYLWRRGGIYPRLFALSLTKAEYLLMRKPLLLLGLASAALVSNAQSALDAYTFSQPDLKGTARFMGMAGAFGALGADLSTLSQNPAGIGVYRSSDIGFTLDLDCQSSSATSMGLKTSDSQTRFLLNNIGAVFTLRLASSAVPNINIGFTYNKNASFNRVYSGGIPNLTSSLSNYIAACTTSDGWSEDDLLGDEYYNPYNSNVPWLDVLGYDGFLFNREPNPNGTDAPYYLGQFEPGTTTGNASFRVKESGGIDSYNIALGGNIANVVFWGMDFDITHLNYTLTPTYAENLQNAYVESSEGVLPIPAKWQLSNYYNASGNGFNFKLGVIVKPIQELRFGFAFHTPTWYSMSETFSANLRYSYNNDVNRTVYTNDGTPGYNDMNFRSPWRFIASVAGVIGGRMIVSADYEWTGYQGMQFSTPSPGGYYDGYYDYGYYPWDYLTRASSDYVTSPFAYTNQDIKDYYRHTDTFRIGAEFRVTDNFSVRGGYSHVSSPVKESARDGVVYTSGTNPSYRLDKTTNYITAGLGYRVNKFYVDLAYVYKHMNSTYHAFSPYPEAGVASQTAELGLTDNQVVLSAGFRF